MQNTAKQTTLLQLPLKTVYIHFGPWSVQSLVTSVLTAIQRRFVSLF